MFDLIFSGLSASDAAEPPDCAEPPGAPEAEVLMIDATDVKAHPTASSLNKGVPPPDWWHQGGHDQQAPWGLDSKGGPLRLHLREGQCSDFTGAADGALPTAWTAHGPDPGAAGLVGGIRQFLFPSLQQAQASFQTARSKGRSLISRSRSPSIIVNSISV